MIESIWITAIYAGTLALIAVVLANFVLFVRLRGNTRPQWQHEAALRVQANFVENVPLAVVLLLIAELQGLPALFLHGCGITLVILRLLHAYGLGAFEGANYPRLIGAQGTFLLVAILAFSCILEGIAQSGW